MAQTNRNIRSINLRLNDTRRTVLMCSLVVTLSAVLLFSTEAALATENYIFVRKWGSPGSGDGQLGFVAGDCCAQGIALDSAGNIFVADYENDRIQKFTSTGTFLTKWGITGSGDGQFQRPGDVAVDSSNNVYVADRNNNRIQKFSNTGTFITKWGTLGSGDGQLNGPMRIALGPSGEVYVADTFNNRIQKFSNTGTFITKWGTFGITNDGEFDRPFGIAVDSSGNVYVSDLGNGINPRIQKFTNTGNFITKWGGQGSADGQFGFAAEYVAIDLSDNVYASDTVNHRIQKFTSTGTFITKWGTFGSADGQFTDFPYGIVIDPSGVVYVVDGGNGRIQVFSTSSTPPDSVEITSADPAYWDVKVGLSGTTSQFGDSYRINIDWGDGSAHTIVNPTSASWSLPSSSGHAYSQSNIGNTYDIVATLEVSNFDGGYNTIATSAPFSETVQKHPTKTSLFFESLDPADPNAVRLEDTVSGAKFQIGGTLTDNAPAPFQGTRLADKPISFSGTIGTLVPATTTQGIKFFDTASNGLSLDDCSTFPSGVPAVATCSVDDPASLFGVDPNLSDNMVFLAGPGTEMVFPLNVIDAQLYLQDMGFATFDWVMHDNPTAADPSGPIHTPEIPTAAAGPGSLIIPTLGIGSGSHLDSSGNLVPNGIHSLRITSVDPDGAGPSPACTDNTAPGCADAKVGIAAIVTHSTSGEQQYVTSFETESAGALTSPYEAPLGVFFSTGTAPVVTGAALLRQTALASFSSPSDPLYAPSTSQTGLIDVNVDTYGIVRGTVGSGGLATTVTSDSGNDITIYNCAAGNDVDGDGVCDSWEGSTVAGGSPGVIDVGGASYNLCGTTVGLDACDAEDGSINSKDLYVELDTQSGYALTSTAINNIKSVFNNAPTPPSPSTSWKLHLTQDETNLDATLFPTKVWKQTNSAWLRGSQIGSMTNPTGTPTSKTISVGSSTASNQLKVTTGGAVTCAKITMKQKFTVATVQTSVSAGIPSIDGVVLPGAGLTMGPAGCAFSSATPTLSADGKTVFVSYVIPFSTPSAISDISIGKINVVLTLNPGFAGTVTVNRDTGSPIIKTNSDFDGIKKNNFGTQTERNTAGGTLGMAKADMVAKAQVYHYALAVRLLGNDKFTCGDSGEGEDGGNDFIIALGPKQTSAIDSTPINCFGAAAGTDNEQTGTFLHELGHNFGLKHGGGDDDNCKANYPSVMSYTKQVPISGFGTWNVGVAGYSRQVLAQLDERIAGTGSGITESNGNGLRLDNTKWGATLPFTYDIVYSNGAGTAYTATLTTAGTIAINWDRSSTDSDTTDPNIYGQDLNYVSTVLGCNTAGTKSVLVGFDDWAQMATHLNFRSGGALDGLVYPVVGENSELNGKIYNQLIEAGNKGKFNGLLEPINKVTKTNLQGVSAYPVKATIPLKVTYTDDNNNPIVAELHVKIVKILPTTLENAVTESTTPLASDSGDLMRFSQGQYIFNLSTANLQAGSVYGVEIWNGKPGDVGSFKLDTDTDGYAGFFELKQK